MTKRKNRKPWGELDALPGVVIHARIPNSDGCIHPLKALCKNPRAVQFDVSGNGKTRTCKACIRAERKK